VGLSLSAAPAALLALEPSPSRPGVAIRVAADADRFEQPCKLGDQSTIACKLSAADTAGQLLLIENHAAGRFGPPRHVHHDQDEWFHVIAGEVAIEVGEQKFRLLPGDSLFAPRGIPHVWAQVAPSGGRLLIAFQPAGKMESFFSELGKLGGFPPPAQARELFEQHGMSVVGPPLAT
jgi:mannose-6-phosphate isomerase-like protein (cupin superfamily)